MIYYNFLPCLIISLFLESSKAVLSEQVFDNGKVFNLIILHLDNQKHLLACGPEGEIKLYKIEFGNQIPTSLKLISTFILPHSKQRWVTDAILYNNAQSGFDQWKLVCGDRRGSLHLFDESSTVNWFAFHFLIN